MYSTLLSSIILALLPLTFGQHTIYSPLPNGQPRIPNGPHGQDCSPGVLADKCPVWGMTNQVVGAEVACQHNYDCCTCGQILCTGGCVALVCNGDAACFGVKNIILAGDSYGVSIICNGTYPPYLNRSSLYKRKHIITSLLIYHHVDCL